MTLHQLRALCDRAHGPAVERLPDRTPEGVARAYLPKKVRVIAQPSGRDVAASLHAALMWDKIAEWSLDLTDPGTVNAVKVALALALGLDPGPMGCAVSWRYGAWGWVLRGAGSSYIMSATTEEPDAIKALVLAVEHVLGAT